MGGQVGAIAWPANQADYEEGSGHSDCSGSPSTAAELTGAVQSTLEIPGTIPGVVWIVDPEHPAGQADMV